MTFSESPKLAKQGEIASYYTQYNDYRTLVIDVVSGNPPPQYKWFIQSADHCRQSNQQCKPRPRRWIPSYLEASPPPGVAATRSAISLPPTKRNFFYKVEASNLVGVDKQIFSVIRTCKSKYRLRNSEQGALGFRLLGTKLLVSNENRPLAARRNSSECSSIWKTNRFQFSGEFRS